MTPREFMSIPQLSEHFGKHENTIYRWLDNGTLPGVKVGGMWYVTPDDVASVFSRPRPEPAAPRVRQPVERAVHAPADAETSAPVPLQGRAPRTRRARATATPLPPRRKTQYALLREAM